MACGSRSTRCSPSAGAVFTSGFASRSRAIFSRRISAKYTRCTYTVASATKPLWSIRGELGPTGSGYSRKEQDVNILIGILTVLALLSLVLFASLKRHCQVCKGRFCVGVADEWDGTRVYKCDKCGHET